MAEVNFFLRNPNSLTKTSILLSFYYDGFRLRLSTSVSVVPSGWNSTKQRVYKTKTNKEAEHINRTLEKLSRTLEQVYEHYTELGIIPTPAELKQRFLSHVKSNLTANNQTEFWRIFEQFLRVKQQDVKDITDFDLSLRKHLMACEMRLKTPITFEGLQKRSNSFFQEFEHYLQYEAKNIHGGKGLAVNTIGKQMKNLKVFLHWCFEINLVNQFSVKHMVSRQEDIDAVYLTKDELIKLRELNLDEAYSRVRDLFLIGCETGLRFSDFSSLTPANIGKEYVEVRPKKTRKEGLNSTLLIPISNNLRSVLNKHKGVPPRFKQNSLNSFNSMIRELCKQAGIKERVNTYRLIAGKEQHLQLEKWRFVSSHTCRRTFCTLKFLDGMPAQAIMKFSGHKSERNFMRYLRLDAKLNAEHYKSFFN